MAKTSKPKPDTASIVENEKNTIETETQATEETSEKDQTTEEIEETSETSDESDDTDSASKSKAKRFKNDEKVIIKCLACAGKTISLPKREIKLDDKGKCEVTGEEANRLLTIPGYELAK